MLGYTNYACQTIGFWNYHEGLNKDNYMFENTNAFNGDDLLLPIVELGKSLKKMNIRAATLDVLDPDEVDSYVFMDMPDINNTHFQTAIGSGKPVYLLILESPMIRPENFDEGRHSYFRKIFTYNDDQVDDNKYIKINYAFSFNDLTFDYLPKKEKLCVMIASNKKLSKIKYANELCSERLNAIKWFEKYHMDDFDLYGYGWKNPPGQSQTMNPFKAITNMISPGYKCYKGILERKKPVLKKYRFAICYENVKNVSGYITEKIFDCFFAGCVPVYLGANNINDYIPSGCFIDKRNFNNYEELYEYMTCMSEREYEKYLENIEIFLKSNAARSFSINNFVNIIIDGIS